MLMGMGIFWKKETVPPTPQVEVTSAEAWAVRWTSVGSDSDYERIGSKIHYSVHQRQRCKFFLKKEDAEAFADKIKEARTLLQDVVSKYDIVVEPSNK